MEKKSMIVEKQGQIHGQTVADGWAGAVMQKPLVFRDISYKPTDLLTYRPTRRGVTHL